MKQKLFENHGGNTFKLITEGIGEVNPNAKLVRSGLKIVFSAGNKSLSYKRLQGVGLAYIRSVEEAKKTAIQEARILAEEYGYTDDEYAQKFMKEDDANTNEPTEAREVQIGKEIIRAIKGSQEPDLSHIIALAYELIKIHSADAGASKV